MNHTLSDTFAVTRIELRRLMVRPLGWVLAALTLAWMAWTFLVELEIFLGSQIELAAHPDGTGYIDHVVTPVIVWIVILFAVVVPLLTMTSITDERRNGTLQLLFGAGASSQSIVLGKYLATLVWLWSCLGLILVMALTLPLIHAIPLDWGWLAAIILGLVLMLAAMAALGMACSAFSPHPVIAAALAIVITLALWLGNTFVQMTGTNNGAINWLMMSTHVQPMFFALVSSADVLWLLLLIAVSLALATRRLTADKERG